MKVIVGLGNVGNKCTHTRHNAGFLTVEMVARELGLDWQKCGCECGELAKDRERRFWLFKPGWYMNRSGEALLSLVNYYKINDGDLEIIIIHDDLDLPLGEMRLRTGGGAGGHNGVLSIMDVKLFDWDKVVRYRLGIGRPASGVTDSDVISNWVLSGVGQEDELIWNKMIEECGREIIKQIRN